MLESRTRTAAHRHFIGAHTCNAYCRNGQHATVIWVVLKEFTDEAQIEDGAKNLCDNFGVTFVTIEPAPEAKPVGGRMADYNDRYGIWEVSEDTEPRAPYLLVWSNTA